MLPMSCTRQRSTGTPKGVTIPHNAVTQALLAHDEYVPTFNRFLQFAAPTFDVSVFETFFPLFRGATLVTRHREDMLGDLPGTLRGLAVDAAELTPTVAGTLLRSREAAPSLRLLLTIGEMLTRAVVEEFAQAMDRKRHLAAYVRANRSFHPLHRGTFGEHRNQGWHYWPTAVNGDFLKHSGN